MYKESTTFYSVIKASKANKTDAANELKRINSENSIITAEISKNITIDIDLSNDDLLPIEYEAFNVNYVNRNDDCVGAADTVNLYKSFIGKALNKKHNRTEAVGFNIYSNLFNTNGSALTDEEAKIQTEPFNCIITSLLWKIVAPNIAEYLETTAAEDQNQIYASFEVGFNEFDIVVIEGASRKLQDAKEIISTDNEKFNEYKEKLKCYGGTGKIDDNLFIYRKIKGELIGLGMALVENPAAFVEPVKVLNNTISEEKIENTIKSGVNIEQNKQEITMAKEKITKINSIEEITAENLSICEATAITDFINEQIKKASDDWVTEKTAKEKAISELQTKNAEIEAEAAKNKTELETIVKELNELKSRIAAAEAQDLFNQRMASFEDEYELTDEERTVIANDIKDLTNETFETYAKKMKVLMKSKKKCGAKCGDKEMKAEVSNVQQVATAEEVKEAKTVVDNAVENGTKDPVIPNAATPAPTFAERIANAFKLGDNVTLEDRRRRKIM